MIDSCALEKWENRRIFTAEPPPIGTSTHMYFHPEVPIDITLLSKLSTHHKVIRASVSLFYLEHHFTSPLFSTHKHVCI